MEKIVASAIKFYLKDDEYPIIMSAKRHCDVFEKMYNFHLDYIKSTAVQGFLTTEHRFVDRYDAAVIAYRADQTEELVNYLYSEDIWPPEENDTI